MLPEHYALLTTTRVAEAEQEFRKLHGAFGSMTDLTSSGLLESKGFAKYMAGAVGYSFKLENRNTSYLFSATARNSLAGPAYSVDESGVVATVRPQPSGEVSR
jgi:hypothetical protein